MLLEQWLAWGVVTHGWKPTTQKSYRNTIVRFERWLQDNGSTLEAAEPFGYKAFLATLPPTASSINQAVKALRRWGEWLEETGRRDVSPSASLRPQKNPKRVPRPFTPAEADRIISAAVAEGGAVVAAIALQLLAGLRHTEMRTLRWGDIDDKLNVTGKGDRQRRIPISRPLRSILVAWRLACPPSDWVFPSPQDPTRPVAETTLRQWTSPVLQGQRPHRMRATFATDIGRRGGAHAIRDLLGHASVSTSDAYVRYEETELDDLVQGLSYAQES